MELENLKLCENCKHYVDGGTCARTQMIDFVHGKHFRETCQAQRSWDNLEKYCGAQAKFFEPKP